MCRDWLPVPSPTISPDDDGGGVAPPTARPTISSTGAHTRRPTTDDDDRSFRGDDDDDDRGLRNDDDRGFRGDDDDDDRGLRNDDDRGFRGDDDDDRGGGGLRGDDDNDRGGGGLRGDDDEEDEEGVDSMVTLDVEYRYRMTYSVSGWLPSKKVFINLETILLVSASMGVVRGNAWPLVAVSAGLFSVTFIPIVIGNGWTSESPSSLPKTLPCSCMQFFWSLSIDVFLHSSAITPR